MKVMVLAGGPDRERDVSLASGQAVTEALEAAGHDVRQRDISPGDLTALDDFSAWGGGVIFPALHGRWGEGGGIQKELVARELRFVGSLPEEAALCMDKYATKRQLMQQGLPTPDFSLLTRGHRPEIPLPYVIKPLDEGSSIDMAICKTQQQAEVAMLQLMPRYEKLLVERFIVGMELTVGIIEDDQGEPTPLPPIHIVPASSYYDYAAKYLRDDTQYRFDIDLPQKVLTTLSDLAVQAHEAAGPRHLSRVDFMVEPSGLTWILELNTMPGFTNHSLVPKAAAHAGIPMPVLCDRLCQLAMAD